MKKLGIAVLAIVVLVAAAGAYMFVVSRGKLPPERTKPEFAAYERPPANPLRSAWFGETHLHTTYSLDANLFGTKNDPRMAYRFAMGEEVYLPESKLMHRIPVPLDFAAITDHAESLGMYQQCYVKGSESYNTPSCIGMRLGLMLMFPKLVGANTQSGKEKGRYSEGVCGADGARCKTASPGLWKEIQAAANDYYQPGRFTTFIAFEYSPTLQKGGMLHRNVIFGSDTVPDEVFSSFDGFAEDLWRWLDAKCTGDCKVLSIPHNPNMSWGLQFGELNSDTSPVTPEDRALRAKHERLVEVIQIKGSSECGAGIGNNDEECGFENLFPACTGNELAIDPLLGQHAPRCVGPNDTVRQILKKGMVERETLGFNPFKLGFVGGTDSHNGTPGDTVESNWSGHGGKPDATAELRLGYQKNMVGDTLGFPLVALNPGALAGVWAEENTRVSIFAAMQRRETFVTSGTRIKVRLFGGFDLVDDLHAQPDAIARAYALGVPMGGDLPSPGAEGQAPRFMVQALRDANSAPLSKIQIIKGWVANGVAEEEVYDVVCSDGRKPDPVTHRCADNGATVDPADCSVSADKGAGELAATWKDPAFDPAQPAFYYARVLENPSCRWTQYDANRLGKPMPASARSTLRERAMTSPIWYEPAG